MKLLITTQSYSYFKRQWWQLSSIINQIPIKRGRLPDVTYRIHLFNGDPNIGLAHKMIDVFSPLINLDPILWVDKNQYAHRGNTRNKDIKDSTKYDAILFLDPDIILHQELLARLKYFYSNADSLVALGRTSVNNAETLITNESYDKPIENIMDKINDNEINPFRSARGAGFFQYITTNLLKEKNITTYCRAVRDKSIFDPVHYGTYSEQVFRKNVGKIIFGDKLSRVWHMEHERHKVFDCK